MGCMLLTGTAVAVRRGGGVAVVQPLVLTVVAVIAAFSVSRQLCSPRLKPAAGWACLSRPWLSRGRRAP